jgi:hypothetical protein
MARYSTKEVAGSHAEVLFASTLERVGIGHHKTNGDDDAEYGFDFWVWEDPARQRLVDLTVLRDREKIARKHARCMDRGVYLVRMHLQDLHAAGLRQSTDATVRVLCQLARSIQDPENAHRDPVDPSDLRAPPAYTNEQQRAILEVAVKATLLALAVGDDRREACILALAEATWAASLAGLTPGAIAAASGRCPQTIHKRLQRKRQKQLAAPSSLVGALTPEPL